MGNGHGAELLAGGPELGHVTLGDHGVAAGSPDHAVGGVGADGSAGRCPDCRRAGCRRNRQTAAVIRPASMAIIAYWTRPRFVAPAWSMVAAMTGWMPRAWGDLVGPEALEAGRGVFAEDGVDVVLLQSGVLDGELGGLDGELKGGDARDTAKLGGCRPDDTVLVFEGHQL